MKWPSDPDPVNRASPRWRLLDPSVPIDLFVKSLFNLGAKLLDIARALRSPFDIADENERTNLRCDYRHLASNCVSAGLTVT